MTDLIRNRLMSVPNRPGCYLMRDRQGVIIYVGKAKNLRKRVSSYFRPRANHAPKVRSMVETVYDFEFMTVRNEAEALLTESALIKRYKPHFNILMRDDKRYLALRADSTEEWPRFTCERIIRNDNARYFGPFPSGLVVREAKDFVEKEYGIRACDAPSPNAETKRHCSANIIRRCSAPCIGAISNEEYRAKFEEACEFLSGHRPSVLTKVSDEMHAAAKDGEFEKAARLRDTLFAIKEITKSYFVRRTPEMQRNEAEKGLQELADVIGLNTPPKNIECIDISNLFGSHNVASLVVARNGVPDKRFYRRFKISSFEGADDPRAMAEVVYRRFTSNLSTLPDLLICDGGITQLRATRQVLNELALQIPTIGLAEKQELIVLDDGRDDVFLPRDSAALMIITRLRDEAHRFALTYHRHLREKTIRESVIDSVVGVGPAKKMKLLRAFKSISGIARASIDEIAHVAGVSQSIAQEILNKATSCH